MCSGFLKCALPQAYTAQDVNVEEEALPNDTGNNDAKDHFQALQQHGGEEEVLTEQEEDNVREEEEGGGGRKILLFPRDYFLYF